MHHTDNNKKYEVTDRPLNFYSVLCFAQVYGNIFVRAGFKKQGGKRNYSTRERKFTSLGNNVKEIELRNKRITIFFFFITTIKFQVQGYPINIFYLQLQ